MRRHLPNKGVDIVTRLMQVTRPCQDLVDLVYREGWSSCILLFRKG